MVGMTQVSEAVFRGRYDDQVTAAANAATAALQKNTVAVTENEQAVKRQGQSAGAIVNRYDEVTRATRALDAAQTKLAQAQRTLATEMASGGAIGADQATRAMRGLEAAVAKAQERLTAAHAAAGTGAAGIKAMGDAAGITTQQFAALTPQLNDIATQLAGGSSPFLIMMQQGPQITQIFGGLRNTLAAVSASLGPVGIAAAATAVGLASIIGAAESQARALNALQNSLRATRGDYEDLSRVARDAAREFANSTQFGRSEATGAAGIIGSAPEFSGRASDMRQLLTLAGDLSVVLGRDLAGAADTLRKAFSDPLAVATELADRNFRGFEATTVSMVRRLQEGGDKMNATSVVLRRLTEAVSGAANNRTEIEQGWTSLFNTIARGAEMAAAATRPLADALNFVLRHTIVGTSSPIIDTGGSPGGDGPSPQDRRLNDALTSAAGQGRGNQIRAAQDRLRALREALPLAENGDQRATLRSGMQGAAQELQGLKGPAAQQMEGLQDARRLAESQSGAAREVLQAQLALNRALEQAGEGTANQTQLERVRTEVLGRLRGELDNLLNDMGREAQADREIAAAYRESTAAGQAWEVMMKAQKDALKYGEVGTQEYSAAVRDLTRAEEERRAAAAERRSASGSESDQRNQLELLRQEISLVGASTTERERELAVMRERQKLDREPGLSEETRQRRLGNARDIADANQALARQRDALTEVQNIGTQAFDRIGNAITEAFAQGKLSAISFANIGKAVISELLQGFLKLAIVNPLKNALFGRNAGTLSDLASAKGGGGALGGVLRFVGLGGGSSPSVKGSALASGGSALSYAQIESLLQQPQQSGFMANVGGFGGLLQNGRTIMNAFSGQGSNTGIGFVDNALNYQVFGSGYGGAIGAADAAGIYAAGGGSIDSLVASSLFGGSGAIGGAVSPEALNASGLSFGGDGIGMTVGQGLGAAGSLFSAYQGFARGGVGGYIQGVGGVVGGGMQIASMLGLGASLGPWGLAIAAVAAILGSLFGGKKSWKGGYVGVGVNSNTGKLDILSTISKGVDLSKEIAETQKEIDQLNSEIEKRGLYIQPEAARVTKPTQFQQKEGELYGFIAAAGEAKTTTDWKQVDIAIANNLKAHNQDKDVQRAIDISFGGGLEGALWNVDFVLNEYKPAIKALEAGGDRYSKALKDLADKFGPLIERAGTMGLAIGGLQEAWDKARIAIEKERDITKDQLTGGIEARRLRATGKTDEAALLTFDINARAEALQMEASLMDVGFGRADIDAQLAKLAQVQALERVSATGSGFGGVGGITSLADYARSLRGNGLAPTNPMDRLSTAEREFNAVASAAAAGDAKSIASFQGYANEYLVANRAVYGSGEQYSNAFKRVTDYISSIAETQADQLTASIFGAETQAQTQAIVSALESVRDAVTSLQREAKLGAFAPDRSAA